MILQRLIAKVKVGSFCAQSKVNNERGLGFESHVQGMICKKSKSTSMLFGQAINTEEEMFMKCHYVQVT